MQSHVNVVQAATRSRKTPGHGSLLYRLALAFSTSLEGSVIEMKPTGPVLVDTVVNLKAKLAITSEWSVFIENAFNFLSCV